eukprot:g32595.t1
MMNGEFQTTALTKSSISTAINPNVHKQSYVRILFKWVGTHSNTSKLHKKEEEHLSKLFAINGYPTNFIRRCRLDRQHQQDTICPNTLATL